VAYAEALDVTGPAIEGFFAKHLHPESPPANPAPEGEAAAKSPYVVIEDGGTGPLSHGGSLRHRLQKCHG
jgi:hypothetical protein